MPDRTKSLPVLLWRDAGCSAVVGAQDVAGSCLYCGATSTTTLSAARAVPASFTAYDQCKAPGSSRLCAACAWTAGGRSSATRHTWRLYSVLWREDGDVPPRQHPKAPDGGPRSVALNRSDMRPILDVILRQPSCAWAASIAESGQLQCIPFCPVVPAGGAPRVLFERDVLDVSAAPAVMPHVAALRAMGVSAEEITGGAPSAAACMRIGAEGRRHLDALRDRRGDRLVHLLAWALKRDHAEGYA